MIEVLIAMVVVAVGVLGISRMQVTMLRNNQSALLRSQASILAYDMIDRMRADRQGAIAGDYDHTLGDTAPGTATVAAAQLSQWLTTLDSTLPAGDGGVSRNGQVVQVTVRWNDSRGQEAPLVFTTAVEL
ncbi:type IV pilus modification protein PilV [gamma proteobacterium NOR5-3]|nr:type IV pilus modification protein PilV [gamma proteobacterium NOR5-3]